MDSRIRPEENDPTIVSSKVRIGQENSNRSEEQTKELNVLPPISIFFSSRKETSNQFISGKRTVQRLTAFEDVRRKALEEDKFNTYLKDAQNTLLKLSGNIWIAFLSQEVIMIFLISNFHNNLFTLFEYYHLYNSICINLSM